MSWTWQPTDEYDPIKAGSIDATDTRPHDRGIIRATQAYYDPTYDPNISGNPKATVMFARVAFDTSDETLRALFAKYGAIRRMRLVRHVVTGASRGYGFVEYERESDARAAYTNAHRAVVDGRQIVVDFERERTMEGWIPRRLGGGLGGRKESGQLRFGGHDRPFRRPILSSTPEAQWALDMMSRSRAPPYSSGGGGERGERHRDSAYAKEERRPEARDEGHRREREERGDSRREYSRDTDRDRPRDERDGDRGRRSTEERRDRYSDDRDRDRRAEGRDRDRHVHRDERSDADAQRHSRSEHRHHSSAPHGHSRESSHRD